MVALFVWYWDHTRTTRTFLQWALLGLIAGLMIDVYYPNAVLLLFPLLESLSPILERLVRRSAEFLQPYICEAT